MSLTSQLVLNFGALSVEDHPNKLTLKGVLTRLDEPSTKAPNGSEGHRILLPSSLAKKRLDTLIGMGLNYAPDMGGHAQRRKVGVITKAWISGQDLHIEATVWKHDFPEAEKDLKQPGLGMSMEVGDVDVEDDEAPIWVLKDLCFLGATVLWQKSAAYHRTQAIAAAAKQKENDMAVQKKKTATGSSAEKVIGIAAAAAAKAVGDQLTPVLGRQIKLMAEMATRLEKLDATAETEDETQPDELDLLASDLEAACDSDEMKAGKRKKEDDMDEDDGDDDEEDDDDDIDAEEINKGGLEEMGPKTGDDAEDDDDPGDLNKGATNRGRKTDVMDKVGKTVSSSKAQAVLARALKVVKAQQETITDLQASMRTLEKKLARQTKQIAAASSEMNRRSLDASTLGLLAKAGISASQLRESGEKLTVAEVDAVFDSTKLNLPVAKRIEAKNNLIRAGLMEEGALNRGIGL